MRKSRHAPVRSASLATTRVCAGFLYCQAAASRPDNWCLRRAGVHEISIGFTRPKALVPAPELPQPQQPVVPNPAPAG